MTFLKRGWSARCAGIAALVAMPVLMQSALAAGWQATPANTRPAQPAKPAPTFSHGRFVDVPIRLPPGNDVKRFVLWFADGMTPAQREARVAALAADGAMVATVDVPALELALRKDGGRCIFSAGDVENFSRYVQAYYRLPTYRAAILLGDGEGAGLAYAMAAQADKGTFAGAVSIDFCPQLKTARTICPSGALQMATANRRRDVTLRPAAVPVPWSFVADEVKPARCDASSVSTFAAGVPGAQNLARDAQGDALPALRAALQRIGARRDVSVPPPPADLAGLPIVEVPAAAGKDGDTFAVFASGDGGWAGLDKDVAGALAEAGIPVAGLDSLRYFWTARTPQVFAKDLDRIVRYYAHRWGKKRVVLVGFSQGADVLPAAINRLPPTTSSIVSLYALMSIGKVADYEFHVANWLGGDGEGLPIAPEMAKLPASKTLCLYGEDDDDAICPTLPRGSAIVEKLPGDHHFGGDYARLASVILKTAQAEEKGAK